MRLAIVGIAVALATFCQMAAADEVLEAEAATLHGVEVSEHAGASGGKRVTKFDAVGDSITFAGVSARCLRIRYSLGRPNEVRCTLRAGDKTQLVVFRPTGSWNRYATRTTCIENGGSVELRITADDCAANGNASCASIDSLEALHAEPPEESAWFDVGNRIYKAQLSAAEHDLEAWDFANSVRDDGSWADIDYKTVSTTHLERTRRMSAARYGSKFGKDKPQVYERAIVRALKYWVEHDFRDPNWWVNEIAIPKPMADLLLVVKGDIPDDLFESAVAILYRAWPPPENSGKGQGANLFYRMHTATRLACIRKDGGMLRYVCQRAADEISITTGEGLQDDFSFHQHGPQLYSGSYGLEYISSAADLVKLTAGTSFAVPAEKIALLSALILDHLQFMIRGRMIDPGAQGRNFSREGFWRGATVVARVCRTLAECGVPRAAEFTALANRISDPEHATPWPDVNRMFWRSDFMAHSRSGWYASAKMASTRTEGSEGGNGEGLKQFHLADGACFIMQRGDEYRDMPPIMDWRKIPGITCEQDSDPWPRIDWGFGMKGTTRFAGGVSDGRIGMAALDFKRDRVTARKSWVFFDDCVVALGADITCSGNAPVVTTLNQCRQNGEATHYKPPANAAPTRTRSWC